MAPAKAASKRKNKRKVRTEVSSPSASESESDAASPPPAKKADKKSIDSKVQAQTSHSDSPDSDSDSDAEEAEPVFTKRTVADPEQAFEDFYLKQATKEFANDLDKLRAAGDFNATKSVPLLVAALRQGTACFGKEERRKIGSAVASGE
ncbi:hypothetical protein LTR56_022784 [Elasticomyces elasticus]|nr:hypothetical protein LTR22_025394 [Elasticomyces elasticus]KAK3621451.1 hypothetical protein LTR56_022784 [Elasticomyces elasticus]KAK4904730.1 hypothetical protein LTR49_025866 [Elasticomyces elasticus]KAK5741243.1 hypothetical protein LTS12_024674 [Elasticomyces elasticus]